MTVLYHTCPRNQSVRCTGHRGSLDSIIVRPVQRTLFQLVAEWRALSKNRYNGRQSNVRRRNNFFQVRHDKR
jgi:hypothetical protein